MSGLTIPAWACPAPTLNGAADRTRSLALRPLSATDILDEAIKLLRADVGTMALIVATFVVPFEIGLAFLQRNINGGNSFFQALRDPTASSQSSSTAFVIIALGYLTYWVALPLVCAAVSRVVMSSYLGGHLAAKEAIVAAIKRAPALLVATLIVHVAELLAGLGFVVGIAFVMPLFIMTAPAISVEELGPIAGISRSTGLARRRYWPTLGVALFSGLLAYVLNQMLGLVPRIVAVFIGLRWGWLVIAATSTSEAFVTVSLITIVATLVYLDNRIRQEGLDLYVTVSELEHPDNAEPSSSQSRSSPSSRSSG